MSNENTLPTVLLLVANDTSGCKVACNTVYDAEKLTKLPARIIGAMIGGFINSNCSVHGWRFKIM